MVNKLATRPSYIHIHPFAELEKSNVWRTKFHVMVHVPNIVYGVEGTEKDAFCGEQDLLNIEGTSLLVF